MNIKLVVGLAVAAMLSVGTAQAGECKNPNEIKGLFDQWNSTLQTGNPEAVADLYAKEGVLLPTVSNKVRADHAEIADYFHHFLALKPHGTLNEVHLSCINEDVAINSGIYTFDIVRDGKPEEVKARYSFVYLKEDGEWKIISHHSSKMPEPPK